MPPLLSLVVPVFNELATLQNLISKVNSVTIDYEIILIDDCSTDGTTILLNELEKMPNLHVIHHHVNRGKGAALRTGFAKATGEVVIVQDADLEHDPHDYPKLIEPIIRGVADVVFGSRFLPESDRIIPRKSYWANWVITWFFNLVNRQHFTDVETCYKAFRRTTLQQIQPSLRENRFGIEIELVAKLSKLLGIRIIEVPIRYRARTYEDGKKIGFKDGLRALWCIIRYRNG